MKSSAYSKFISAALLALSAILLSVPASAGEVLASGGFTGASDHVTTGGVTVVKSANGLKVVLGSDFSLDGAPDPKVGFGTSGKYDSKAQLAHLQSNTGEQTYAIPASLDISGYNEIYIWCEKFSVPLGVAKIN